MSEESERIYYDFVMNTRLEVYRNLLRSQCSSGKVLSLTKHDSEIYYVFRKLFPNYCVVNLTQLTQEEQQLTCAIAQHFSAKVPNYDESTLIRIDCRAGWDPENLVEVGYILFLCIEVCRNVEHHNLTYNERNSEDNGVGHNSIKKRKV